VLLNLLTSSKGNPAVDELIVQVMKLKGVFDKIKIEASPVRPEYDQATNTTVLRSQVKTDMTPAVFKELATVVGEIRNSFVK
jgi:hypothetical protein